MDDNWALIKWRGQVASAIRGKRGQQFLRDLIAALDAMPEKRLISGDLQLDGEVCALGAVAVAKGLPVEQMDTYDYDAMASQFNVAHQMLQEIMFENDEDYGGSPEGRWKWMRRWATQNLREVPA